MTNVQMDADRNILSLQVDITEVTKELTRQVEHWQGTADRARQQWEESEWYLGEARASCAYLEEQLQSLRAAYGQLEANHAEATARVHDAERQRNEVNWALSTLRADNHDLCEQTKLLTEQFVHAQQDLTELQRSVEQLEEHLRGERARFAIIEAQLIAVQTYGERRRASRRYRPDVTAELRTGDGTVLFRGLPRDVSLTGLGFASEEPIHYLVEPVEVHLRFSGVGRPVDALGRLVWQRQETKTAQYFAGCELFEVPPDCHDALEQALAGPVQAVCSGDTGVRT